MAAAGAAGDLIYHGGKIVNSDSWFVNRWVGEALRLRSGGASLGRVNDFCDVGQWCVKSNGLNICRFETFATLRGFILDLLACLKGSEARHRDVRVMDEQIVTSGVGGDESESLVFIEPLYRTCIQVFFSLAQYIGHTIAYHLVSYPERDHQGKMSTPYYGTI
jgi:hypothetical protein